VRVVGEAPRQVFSNPLVADADFDGVVDGDEFSGTYRSDPNNGNTDGDKRDDGQERSAGTNPLVEDFQVTVFFTELTITTDGDVGDAGDIGIDFGIRTPDSSQPLGLSSFRSVYRAGAELTEYLDVEIVPGYLNISDGHGIVLSATYSFSMTKNDIFAIEGAVTELDDAFNYTHVFLGGLQGVKATKAGETAGIRPVFRGSDLLAATSPFTDLTFTFTTADNLAVQGGVEAVEIARSMKMFFFVN
jgi:hypothetical protein